MGKKSLFVETYQNFSFIFEKKSRFKTLFEFAFGLHLNLDLKTKKIEKDF